MNHQQLNTEMMMAWFSLSFGAYAMHTLVIGDTTSPSLKSQLLCTMKQNKKTIKSQTAFGT